MKKILSLLLASLMAVCLLSACGGSDNSKQSEESTKQVAETTENNNLVLGEKYESDKFDITINGYEYSERFDNPVEGLWDMGSVDGQVYIILNYSAYYKEKDSIAMSTFFPNTLDFDDGYNYAPSQGPFVLVASSNEWHEARNSKMNDRDPEMSFMAAFQVDDYVMNEKDKTIKILFNILGEELVFTPPSDVR